jgi:hypothetical protein
VAETSYLEVNPTYRGTVDYLKKRALATVDSRETEVNAHESTLLGSAGYTMNQVVAARVRSSR